MSTQSIELLLGAACLAGGFALVVFGVGNDQSGWTVAIFGMRFEVQKAGPGILFAMIGLVLIVLAANYQNPGPTNRQGAAPPLSSVPSSALPAQAPAPPIHHAPHPAPVPVVPALKYSLTCKYRTGPKAGQVQSFKGVPGVAPAVIGAACGDNQGNVGLAVADDPHQVLSTRCQFTLGIRAGEIQDYAPQAPVPLDTPCTDGAGSTGHIVK